MSILISIFVKDIDECVEKLDECEQNCTNKQGSYLCSCSEGYTTNIINLTKCDGICSLYYINVIMHCLDINECENGTHNCAERCENTLGSFLCNCTLGCKLGSDGASCEGTACIYYLIL